MSVSIDAVIHLTTLKGGSYLTGCCIVRTITDDELRLLADAFGVQLNKDFI